MINLQSPRHIFWLSVAILLLTVVFVALQMGPRPLPQTPQASQSATVEVITAQSGSYRAEIRAYGEARAHYNLALTAKVSGYISEITPVFESGGRVAAGDVLLKVEDSDYRAAVASAEENLADAEVALLEEEREVTQAELAWKMSGVEGEPDSDLTLRQPQLRAAKAAVRNARAQLHSTRQDLGYTEITAPFEAVIVERKVALGGFVNSGAELATLYSADRLEIALALPTHDWSNLPDGKQLRDGNWRVQLTSVDTADQWSGYVLRSEKHRDTGTRQRALIVAVDKPADQSPTLLPGSFLDVEIPGRKLDNLWKLPSSTLSQRGEIWWVTKDNTLSSFSAQALFADADSIYIRAPEALSDTPQRIVLRPLNSYLQGLRVDPREVSGEGLQEQTGNEKAEEPAQHALLQEKHDE